jgi:TolB protein
VTPAAGGSERLVARQADIHSCAWSPDGSWIACVRFNTGSVSPGTGFGNLAPSSILLFPAEGGDPIRLVEPRAFNQSPVWSPDGGQLFFVSNRDGPRDVYALALTSSGRPRGEAVRLTTGLGCLSISLSADGGRLAYAVYSARANIWSLPIPEGAPVTADAATPLTSGSQIVESLRVSRDGRWLVYDSNLRGSPDIYRVPLDGGEPEQLTNDPADEFAGDLSPDGRLVAYHSWRNGTRDLEVKPLDGGPREIVTDTPAQESYPLWSPDGRSLLFYDQVAPRSAFVTRRGEDGRWSPPELLARGARSCIWSPDGRWIAYVGSESEDSPVVTAGPLMIGPADGGEAPRLLDPAPTRPLADYCQWSRDGRTLYYKAHDDQGRASLWSVGAEGGTPRLLVTFDDPDRPSSRPDFATDGRRFFFTIEDRQSDVFVAEVLQR